MEGGILEMIIRMMIMGIMILIMMMDDDDDDDDDDDGNIIKIMDTVCKVNDLRSWVTVMVI